MENIFYIFNSGTDVIMEAVLFLYEIANESPPKKSGFLKAFLLNDE